LIPRLAQHPTDHPLQNAHVRELTADRPWRARCAGVAARAATLHLHLHLHAAPCHDALHALATEQFIYILDASMVIQFHLYRISRELSAQVFGFPFGSLHLASRWMQPCHSAASSSITAASQQHHSSITAWSASPRPPVWGTSSPSDTRGFAASAFGSPCGW
jgi:hypothetical protein